MQQLASNFSLDSLPETLSLLHKLPKSGGETGDQAVGDKTLHVTP